MPIPILTVISQEKRATEISEKLLAQAEEVLKVFGLEWRTCLLYTSPSPRDLSTSRMPSSA